MSVSKQRSRAKRGATPDKSGVVRKTITLPEDVLNFALGQARGPRFGGNLSAFLRTLIVDRYEALKAK